MRFVIEISVITERAAGQCGDTDDENRADPQIAVNGSARELTDLFAVAAIEPLTAPSRNGE